MRKFLLLLIALILSSVFALFSVACGGSEDNDEYSKVTVILNKQNLDITIYDEIVLKAEVKGTEDEFEIVWSSSDKSVVTVSDGALTPLKPGTASVYAEACGKKAECKVQVTDIAADDNSFVAVFDYDPYMNVKVNKEHDLEAYSHAFIGNRQIAGGDFSYSSSNTSVAIIVGGNAVQGVMRGSATITVNGNIKGKTLQPCTFIVNVRDDIEIKPNVASTEVIYQGAGRDMTHPFVTTYTVAPTVIVNGQEQESSNYTAELLVDSKNRDNVTVDAMTITGRKAGETFMSVQVTSADGDTEKEDFMITVAKPYCTVEPSSEISIESRFNGAKANIGYLQLGLTTDNHIVGVAINGAKTESYTYEEATEEFGVIDVDSEHKAPIEYGKDATVTIETDEEIVNTTMTVLAINIQNKADMTLYKNSLSKWNEYGAKPYVIMSANVDYGGDNFDVGYQNVSSFSGTFDGQGHVFSNAVLYNGFLSRLGLGGVVQNVAIVDCSIPENGEWPAFIRNVWGTVKDCYISCDITNMVDKTGAVPLCYACEAGKKYKGERDGSMENVIVVFTNTKPPDEQTNKNRPGIMEYLEGPIKNVYVLTPAYSGKAYTFKQADGSDKNIGVYTTESDYKAVVNSSNATVTGAFDTSANGYWKFNASGMLVFKQM